MRERWRESTKDNRLSRYREKRIKFCSLSCFFFDKSLELFFYEMSQFQETKLFFFSQHVQHVLSDLESCLFWLFLVVLNIWDESAFITRFKRCIGRRGSLRWCEHRTSSSSRFSRLLVVLCVCSSLRDDLLFASLFFFSFFTKRLYWWCN